MVEVGLTLSMISNQAKAFNIVLEQQQAKQAFDFLIEHGELAGKLYGLCGLYHTSPGEFDIMIKSYISSLDTVLVEYYDDTSNFYVRDIVYQPN
jgi:hypothetical protein